MITQYGLPKQRALPEANYAPWLADAEFQAAFAKVVDYTAVDSFRSYELWRLVRQMGRVPGDILEVGVWRGGTGVLMALAAAATLPGRTLHLCDTFRGIVKAGEHDPFYKGGEFADTSLASVQARLDAQGLTNARLHQGIFPEETGAALEGHRFCLAHIDVDVYASARDCFHWVWSRMAPGGVVVFDDYGWVDCAGVIKLVEEELYGRVDGLVLHNLNGHAIVVKAAAARRSFWPFRR